MVSAQQQHTCQQTQAAWRRDQDPIIRSPLFLFSLAGDLAETIGQRAALCQRARGGSQPTTQSDGIRLVDSSAAAQQVRLRAIFFRFSWWLYMNIQTNRGGSSNSGGTGTRTRRPGADEAHLPLSKLRACSGETHYICMILDLSV